MNFPADTITTITKKNEPKGDYVLFRYSDPGSLYDGCVVTLPLEVIQQQYSVCCSPRVHLNDKGELTTGACAVSVWSRKSLRQIAENGYYSNFEVNYEGKCRFIGLSPITVNQAKEILRKEKLVEYGKRYLEDKEEKAYSVCEAIIENA